MKHIKQYESFLDRLEGMVKGKSEKGKVVEEILSKNNMKTEGFGYTFQYLGGSDLTDEEISHPISFLVNYKSNEGKLKFEDGKLSIPEDLHNKKVINIIPMIDKEEKDGVQEHGRIWSSAVIKFNYKFNLSEEVPTLELSNPLLFNIESGQWVKSNKVNWNDEVVKLDGLVDDDAFAKEFSGTIFNQPLEVTYQQFIDEVNKRKDIVDIISNHLKEENPTEEQPKEEVKVEKVITKFNQFK
jgi:hypothetical protein